MDKMDNEEKFLQNIGYLIEEKISKALEPIINKLDNIENRLDNLEKDWSEMKEIQKQHTSKKLIFKYNIR